MFDQLNSKVINNKRRDILNHGFYLIYPVFIVTRHTLIDITNKENVPFRAKHLSKRSIYSFYARITTHDNDNVGHELHVQIFNLPKNKIKNKSMHILFCIINLYLYYSILNYVYLKLSCFCVKTYRCWKYACNSFNLRRNATRIGSYNDHLDLGWTKQFYCIL